MYYPWCDVSVHNTCYQFKVKVMVCCQFHVNSSPTPESTVVKWNAGKYVYNQNFMTSSFKYNNGLTDSAVVCQICLDAV